jgi:hypothetical protein
MIRIIRNKKAVSAVLSTILMILIVVIGMTMAFAFFVNYVRDFQLGRGSSVLELAEIEDVWFHPKDADERYPVKIWLYNYGKIDFEVSSVYVDGNLVTPDPTSITTVQIYDHAWIIVYLPNSWVSNELYKIKIVTARGSVFEGQYAAPP